MGKVRYVGFSNFDHQPKPAARIPVIQKQAGYLPMISSQPRWSSWIVTSRREARRVLPQARRRHDRVLAARAGRADQQVRRRRRCRGSRGASVRALPDAGEGRSRREPRGCRRAARHAWCAPRAHERRGGVAQVLRYRRGLERDHQQRSTTAQVDENPEGAFEVKLTPAEWREVEVAIARGRSPAGAASGPVETRLAKRRGRSHGPRRDRLLADPQRADMDRYYADHALTIARHPMRPTNA